jgi:hypothetical protein
MWRVDLIYYCGTFEMSGNTRVERSAKQNWNTVFALR